ncbi:MAG: signal recognition particle-docking protein FtsY [Candidatus Diapherotrites archaeon]
MFELLKKKINEFKEKIIKKTEIQKETETKQIEEEIPEKLTELPKQETEETLIEIPEKKEIKEKTEEQKLTEIQEKNAEKKPIIPSPSAAKPEKEKTSEPIPSFDSAGEKKTAEKVVTELKQDNRKEIKAKVGLGKKVMGLITGKIKFNEKEIESTLFEFELALLESDVNQETAKEITEKLKKKLIEKEIPKGKENEFIKEAIKETLSEIMETPEINLMNLINSKKPFVILFLGLNGAGKTTSIAKLTHLLKLKGKTVLWASGDTFRAGAIEQLKEHAEKLGVQVIKHQYGADPTAVAFDAVKSAEAKGIDVVLIDSAGRQDTNKNLLEELKKMNRVIKPDLKLYVGEAFTGQALITQVKEFNSKIELDGFILTKIDSDSKGGTAISLLHELKKPIYFIGTGQRYEDLIEFKKEYIIDRII